MAIYLGLADGRHLKPIILHKQWLPLYFLSAGLMWPGARRIWSPIFSWQHGSSGMQC